MRLIKTNLLNQNALVFNYMPAKLCKNKSGWLIEYYIESPITSEICRIRKRVHFIKKRYNSVRDAESHCQKIIFDINTKMANGINPMFSEENPIGYTTISEVVKKFLDEKTRELRPETMRSYNSFSKTFRVYLSKTSLLFICKFGKIEAAHYMDWVYNVRKVSQRSYNNYLKFMRVLFNWAMEKGYILTNPFEKIKTKKNTEKTRILIDFDTRKKIIDYLTVKDKYFLIVCKLVYYSLIRPNEIRQIRIGDIDLSTKVIKIDSEVAKNHKTRFATITEDIISDLNAINIDNYPKDFYLFSGNMKPASVPASPARFRKNWDKLRIKLKLPEEMQLYSLRDTGISEMLKNGIDQLSVMQHADHHSLDITSIYAKHADPNLTNIIYTKAPKF